MQTAKECGSRPSRPESDGMQCATVDRLIPANQRHRAGIRGRFPEGSGKSHISMRRSTSPRHVFVATRAAYAVPLSVVAIVRLAPRFLENARRTATFAPDY